MFRLHYILAAAAGSACAVEECQSGTIAEDVALLQARHVVRRHKDLKAFSPATDVTLASTNAQVRQLEWSQPALPELTTPDETTATSFHPEKLMELKFLDEEKYGAVGGRCLDGNMAGYYYGRGTSNLWIIFMEGGGGCTEKEECEDFAKTSRPEKLKQENYTKGVGLVHHKNEDFNHAHRVYVPYCTGDNHLGQVVTPTNGTSGCEEDDPDCVDQWGLYFSGLLNFKNILHQIFSNEPDSRKMRHILLTGKSAGGVGVVHQCDWLQDLMTGQGLDVEVSCAPISSWPPPPDPEDPTQPASFYSDWNDGVKTTPENFAAAFLPKINLHQRYISPKCRDDYEGKEWMCSLPFVTYPYTGPRMHLTHYKYDSLFIGGMGFPDPKKEKEAYAAANFNYYEYVGNAWKTTFATALKENDGVFLPACNGHTGGGIAHTPEGVLVEADGVTYSSLDSVTSWYFKRGDVPRVLIEDCEPGAEFSICGQHCPKPTEEE